MKEPQMYGAHLCTPNHPIKDSNPMNETYLLPESMDPETTSVRQIFLDLVTRVRTAYNEFVAENPDTPDNTFVGLVKAFAQATEGDPMEVFNKLHTALLNEAVATATGNTTDWQVIWADAWFVGFDLPQDTPIAEVKRIREAQKAERDAALADIPQMVQNLASIMGRDPVEVWNGMPEEVRESARATDSIIGDLNDEPDFIGGPFDDIDYGPEN